MNKNVDLVNILKDCPKNTKFYCSLYGEVKLTNIDYDTHMICIENINGEICKLSKDGKYSSNLDGECILFPSKDQKDWSKFTTSWYKKENNVHFYVARDINGELWLYLSKPIRCADAFYSYHGVLTSSDDFLKFGLNEDDYTSLKWENEPIEVFLNLED